MPNHVQNIIRLQGDATKISEMLEVIKNDKIGIGSIDFNKIIPMPESLNIPTGLETENGLKAYQDFIKNYVYGKTAEEAIKSLENIPAESEEAILKSRKDISQHAWECGKTAWNNIQKYGFATWYDWSVSKWGTKWNAYGMSEDPNEKISDGLQFQTAWSAPHPILEKLTQMYPHITFEHEWADEDIGVNCGRHTYQDGERMEEYYPEGNVESTEFALSIWGYEASDLSLILNATGTKYINMEMEEYELIELFGEPALFSNERLTADDIPEGLYCYNLRHTDDGNSFATIEPSVKVNCAGSVITDTPIDFGMKGYIAFTEETTPNFLGNQLTVAEYMCGDFEFEQEQSNKMEDMQL